MYKCVLLQIIYECVLLQIMYECVLLQIMYMYYFVGYELLMKEKNPTTIANPNFDDVPSIFQLLSESVKQTVRLF